MSKLSLREINQSQLDTTPVVDGQLIVCLDTGNTYRDSSVAHVKIASDLEVVSELPLAPLADKIYYLKPDKLYFYNGGEWTLLNGSPVMMEGATEDKDGAAGSVPAPGKGGQRWLDSTGKWTVPENATQEAAGFESALDKIKLDGIEEGANKYVHPEHDAHSMGLYQIAVDDEGHVSNALKVTADDFDAIGVAPKNHTHNVGDLIEGLDTLSDALEDGDNFVAGHTTVTEDATEAKYFRRPLVKLWDYIKSKAEGVFAVIGHNHRVDELENFATHVYDATLNRTKGTVLAAPQGNDGPASFRKLDKNDVGLGNVDNTADNVKNVASATSASHLSGLSTKTNQTWGVQTGTFIHGEDDSTGGSFAFRRDCPSGGHMSMIIDGRFYQNEGRYRVLDTSDAAGLTVGTANMAKTTYINVCKTVNLSSLNVNTWYPVVGSAIPYTGFHQVRCDVHLNSGTKPSWSTHGSGFTAVVDILTTASGWGTTAASEICLQNDQRFISDTSKPPVGYQQLTNASVPVFWLRGGGNYRLYTDWDCGWSIKTSSYTASQQTVAPTTTYPGVNIIRSTVTANLNGNASSASTATTAAKLGRGGNTSTPMTFNWSGQSGQPTWLWGSNDGSNIYVWNPSNFSVKYATSAGSASTATKATGVTDYGDANRTITIGYAGSGATTSNLGYLAGYLTSGTQIKDVSKDVLKSWLGLGGAAYSATSAFAAASHTHNYAGSSSAGGTANSVNGYTFQVSTTDLTAGSSSLATNKIYIVYE